MTRRPTRGQLRAQRRDGFWAARRAVAPTTAAQAGVAFDDARARVAVLPAGEQAAAWRALITHLDSVAPNRNSLVNFTRDSSEIPVPTRTGARRGRAHARERNTTEGARS